MLASQRHAFSSIRLPLGLVAGLILGIGAPAVSQAANPNLGSITPPGARRGTEIELAFAGARLADSEEIHFYDAGIVVREISDKKDNGFKAKVAIAPDCRLGNHALRVRTASGLSNLFLFSVGALEEVAEVEPNNEFVKPQPLPLDRTVNGSVGNEDVDFFAVEAKKGERITVEVEGIRLGRAFFDPYVSIMDQDRFELASSDDAALLWHDGVASIVAPADGTYIIQVRESAFVASGAYRLHVGRFPRPTAVLPAGGKFGQSMQVRWLGDVGGEFTQQVALPAAAQRANTIFAPDHLTAGLFPQDDRGISPSPVMFRLGELDNAIEIEPNDDRATATAAPSAPIAFNGVIGKAGDLDCFKFKAAKGQALDVRVHARSIRSPLDPVLSISRIGGQGVGTNDDSGGPDSYLRFNPPADDEYVVTVTDLLKQGGPDYVYRVEVTPVVPRLTLGLPERVQYVDVTTSVPVGNRMAFLVSAARRDFGGELAVELKDLPPGVTYETVPMAANQNIVPVLVSAAPDARLSGALVDVVGRSTDPKVNVTGRLEQSSLLVRGQNNRPVWTYTADRMATSVTEKAPFRIEVEEPKVPLVRNGQMELKVKAIREGDFKAPIAVRMLYNPPGVSSSGGVSIPEGKDEAVLPLTANNGAEIRSWKVAVIGEATVGNGPVLVSSSLFKLDVADSFFQLAFKPAAVEQGRETSLIVAVTPNTEFPGNAKVELVGLPAEAAAEPVEINKDAKEMTFHIKTSPKTPPGRHKTVTCRAVVTLNGEPVVHVLGPGELRVDAPLPPKPTKPQAAPQPAAVAAQKPAAKPLSRLEQLRQEKEGAKTTTEQQKN